MGSFWRSDFYLGILFETSGTLLSLQFMSESDANGLEIVESWVGITSRSQFGWAIFTATLEQNSLKDVYGWFLTS
jgi:hypothetical protein